MAIAIEIDGAEFTGWESVEVMRSMENFSGSFTIEAAPLDLTDPAPQAATKTLAEWPAKIGSPVRILVNQESVLTGYIESIKIDYGASPDSHMFTITGRDKTADIIDSTCEIFTLTAPTSLEKIAREILKLLGITDIKIITQEGLTIDPFQATDIVSFPYGTSYFDILEEYAHKRQVLVTTDGDGNILFTKGTTTNKFKTILSTYPKTKDTIKKASLSFDGSKKFYKYIAKNMPSDSSGDSVFIEPDNEKDTNLTEEITDERVTRKTRIYNFIAEKNCDKDTLKKRAQWEANFRQTQSEKYSYTVGLHQPPDDPGEIWRANYLVDVQDYLASQDIELLISQVTYRYNLSTGSEADLELVQNNAFSLELKKLEKDPTPGADAGTDSQVFRGDT